MFEALETTSDVMSNSSSAFCTLTRPLRSHVPHGSVVVSMAARICVLVVPAGANDQRRPAIPATCGVDIDVPSSDPYPPTIVLRMFSPGAATDTAWPKLLKLD